MLPHSVYFLFFSNKLFFILHYMYFLIWGVVVIFEHTTNAKPFLLNIFFNTIFENFNYFYVKHVLTIFNVSILYYLFIISIIFLYFKGCFLFFLFFIHCRKFFQSRQLKLPFSFFLNLTKRDSYFKILNIFIKFSFSLANFLCAKNCIKLILYKKKLEIFVSNQNLL